MGVKKVQTSFTAGELSPSMHGRFDDKQHQNGLARCRNFITLPQGPATVRPGTAYVGPTKFANKKARLIPFTFALDQTLALEFGDHYIRFHTRGQTVMASEGVPYEIESPYSADDVFDIHYVQSMDIMTLVHPAYAPRELRRYGATDWRMNEIKFGAPLPAPTISGVTYKVVAPDGVKLTEEEKTRYDLKYRVTSIRETATGFEESSASEMQSVKGNLYLNNATATITWSPVEGADRYRIYKNYKGLYCFIGETNETTYIDDNYDPDESMTPPIYEDPFFTNKGISAVNVTNGGTGYYTDRIWMQDTEAYALNESLHDFPSESAFRAELFDKKGHGTGGAVRLVTHTAEDHDSGGSGENNTWYNTFHKRILDKIIIVDQGEGYEDPYVRVKTRYCSSGEYPTCSTGTKEIRINRTIVGTRVEVSDSTGYGAELKPITENGAITSIEIRSPGQYYTDPKITIKSDTGSGATATATVGKSGDFPGAVTYYEQRRCFAGTPTRPQFVWMTRSGTESDMSHTLPVQDDNRLRFAIAAKEASRILHLTPLSQLLALTNSTEYRISSGGSAPMAPDAIRSEVQAQIGASNVQPVVVNSTAVYAAARGGHLRELGYNWQSAAYVTGDLSIRSAHFFERDRITDMTLAKSPDPIIWAATTSGALLGFTYMPEQTIGGWHRHTTQGGEFETVCSVPEGDEDALYVIVRRVINGQTVRYVERMHERLVEGFENEWHVDCGGEYKGGETKEISGLTWLEGQKVSIFANGCVLPQQVVTDGKVKLTQPSTHVIVGLPITAEFQTLPVAIQVSDGSYGIGHKKNINEVYLRVLNSSGIFVGPDFDKLVEVKQRTNEPYGTPPEPMTGEVAVATYGGWSDSGQVCVRQEDPLPLTITSLAWELAS